MKTGSLLKSTNFKQKYDDKLTDLRFQVLYKSIVVTRWIKMVSWMQVVHFISIELTSTDKAEYIFAYSKY